MRLWRKLLLYVRVAELVDAPGLGPGGATRGSSSLPPDTIKKLASLQQPPAVAK